MVYDAVIVGAGPAGSHLAYLLSDGGASVAVVEKRHFPRDKLCGGLLTHKTMEVLAATYPRTPFPGFPICSVNVSCEGGPNVSFRFRSSAQTVSRAGFDTALAEVAEGHGAHIYWGETLQEIDFTSRLLLLDSGRRLRFKNLIGADGALSTVRRLLQLGKGSLGLCFESHLPWELIKDPCGLRRGSINIYYGGGTGYGWVFPTQETVAIGYGSIVPEAGGRELRTRFLRLIHSVIKEQSKIEYKGAYIPSGQTVVLGREENVYLVGDAAGLIDPFTGEGLYYTLISAKSVAATILSGNKGISDYHERMQKPLNNIREGVLFRDRFYHPAVLKNLIEILESVPAYGETLVDEVFLRGLKNYEAIYWELSQLTR